MKLLYIQGTLFVQLWLVCYLPPTIAIGFKESVKISTEVMNMLEHEVGQNLRSVFIPGLALLTGNVKLDYPQIQVTNISAIAKSIAEETTVLKSLPSINQAVQSSGRNVRLPTKDYLPAMFRSQHPLLTDLPFGDGSRRKLLTDVSDAITRTLSFYSAQLDQIEKPDTVLALLILKEVDDRHGGLLQKKFPLNQWTELFCERASDRSDFEGDVCKSLVRQWKNRSGHDKSNLAYWKSASVIGEYLNHTDDMILRNIGDESEETWGSHLAQCQNALITRCELPYICERTFLDPTPRSQYFLTHQLLQRILVDNAECPTNPSLKSFVTDEETYVHFCSKIYMETKYLDAINVPHVYRDLFSEMVGFCGYMGYTNFLRQDWLNRILSWQSKSGSGCFVRSPDYPAEFFASDIGFARKATKEEMEHGAQPDERCLPHFTAVSLMALSSYYDYLLDSQAE